MQNKFKVLNESNDHKYFTIVPNYIVNHSTPYEQAIYLYMKRVAGEGGTCWTSAQEIAAKLGCSRNTIRKYRDKLVKRGWLELVGIKRAGATSQPTNEYKIVDLWELNTHFYSKKGKGSTNDTFQERGHDVTERGQQVTPEGGRGAHKEEPAKKNPKEDTLATQSVAEKKMDPKVVVLNDLLEKFKNVNPSWRKFFPNKTQRACLQRLLDQHGYDKVEWLIKSLPASNKTAFAPTVTTPFQLEERLGSLIAFWQKQKSRKELNIDVVKVA